MPRINWKQEVFSIPNLLSLFRLVLIPVYILTYLNAEHWYAYAVSAGILAVSCLTDLIDGKIARKYNMITNLGKILDPLADKATQFAMTLCLSAKYPALRSVLILLVIKELLQCGIGILYLHRGKVLSGAIFAGKVCTTVLFASLIIMVLFPALPASVILVVSCLDSFFLMFALISYLYAYFGGNSSLEEWNP